MADKSDRLDSHTSHLAPGESEPSQRDKIALLASVAILAFFAIVILYLVWHIGLPQQQWDRLIFLLNGVEAIAFAATGYLFGKEVNRERAQKAEERAEKAEVEATNGRVLAAVVKVKAARSSRLGGLESTQLQVLSDISELGAIADRLFPN